jgi:putative addiction module component (TIGR02574 family)
MIDVALDTLSIEEKIQMMESLWDSLCTTTSKVASPSWHGDILAARQQAIHDGSDKFEDWEIAKEALRHQAK